MCGRSLRGLTLFGLVLLAADGLAAQKAKPSDSYDELYQRYLEQARAGGTTANGDQAW